MSNSEHRMDDRRWLRTESASSQFIIRLAEGIHALKNRGCAFQALEAEHEAIELMLQELWRAAMSGTDRAEVIEMLNTSIDFCATHFADEEDFLRTSGDAHAAAHAAAHKDLIAKFVAARSSASGEGLSLAVLDASDLLHTFHDHVKTYDRYHAVTHVAL